MSSSAETERPLGNAEFLQVLGRFIVGGITTQPHNTGPLCVLLLPSLMNFAPAETI